MKRIEMKKITNYVYSVDIIRSFAIIAVVSIHVISAPINNFQIFHSSNWWFINTIDSAARAAVPLFIMISGFLLLDPQKKYSLSQFIKKRLSRIGLPIIIWPLIYFLWNMYINHQHFVIGVYIWSYISLNIFYHLYFLYIIAAIYVLTPLFRSYLVVASEEEKKYVLIVTGSFSIFLTFTFFFLPSGVSLQNIFTIFIPYVFYYLAGDFFRNFKLNRKQWYILLGIGTFFIATTALGNSWYMQVVHIKPTLFFNKSHEDSYFFDYLSINVVLQSVIAYILLLNINSILPNFQNSISIRYFCFIAKLAFGIYLVHPLILEILNKISFINIPSATWDTYLWLFLILKTCVILTLSALIVYVGKKIPLLRTIFD